MLAFVIMNGVLLTVYMFGSCEGRKLLGKVMVCLCVMKQSQPVMLHALQVNYCGQLVFRKSWCLANVGSEGKWNTLQSGVGERW